MDNLPFLPACWFLQLVGFLSSTDEGPVGDVIRRCYDRGTALALLGGNMATDDATDELIHPKFTKVAPMMMYQRCGAGATSNPGMICVSGISHTFALCVLFRRLRQAEYSVR
jgi:hypothetical protein